MDRIDKYFANFQSLSSSSAFALSSNPIAPREAKPLKYEAYQDSIQSSPSSTAASSTIKKPFSALPRPSATQDNRTRKQRRLQEDGIRQDMQKSIAKLTLGESSDEQEQDTYEKKKENSDLNESEDVLF